MKIIFKIVPNFKSGIGQMTSRGIKEVTVERITVNRKNVNDEYRILNNHHSLITESESGESYVTMYTSQEKSSRLGMRDTIKERNHLVSKNDSIEDNGENYGQYMSDKTLKFAHGTIKRNASEKGEEFTKRNVTRVVEILNNRWKKNVLEITNEGK